MLACPSCGQQNSAEARFCSACAAPLSDEAGRPREERKIVTVLFADLVGFTARAETMDPEDVRGLLAPYHGHLREELERFGGTVEKFIGDAVMALFGAPVAHEDDAERAVRAALAIRDWVREQDEELQLRIAVSTGEALVDLDARPEAGEGMASGDVVNTAARLQSAAPVNGILVSQTTHRATRDAIDYREHPPVEAKGKAEPISVWEPLEARLRPGDRVQLTKALLIGRSEELELLRGALARVRRERRPQLVTLIGMPGIGKSRLVGELLAGVEAEREPITWRRGRSLPYGDGVSFWALAEIVKAQVGILETDTVEIAEQKLRNALATAITEPPDAQWVERHLRPLVGLSADGAVRGDRRAEAFAAWRRFIAALAVGGPLVLVFEDLHWADEDLLDFVETLVEWLGDVPLLVLCTARPDLLQRRSAWAAGRSDAETISLGPLSDDDTAKLISSLLERTVLRATKPDLLARAAGNPLYAEQYVRMLLEGGDPDELPTTVHGIIAARLDALAPEEKDLLQSAAVVGKVFWPGAVAEVVGSDRWSVEERLHPLERKALVERARSSSVAGETEYAFPHVLVRDVAYAQIPRAPRVEKHRLAAQWIESLGRHEDHAEMLAYHYASALKLARAAGAETGELVDRARGALREAGDRAFGLNAFPAAARFYERALELWPDTDGDRARLLFLFAQALHFGGDERRFEALEQAQAALATVHDVAGAAHAETLLSHAWWQRGQRDRCFAHLDRARVLVAGSPSSVAKARVLGATALLLGLAGDNEAALNAGRAGRALAEELGLDDVRIDTLISIARARLGLGDVDGIEDLDHALELGLETGLPGAARAAQNLAAVTAMAGYVRRAKVLHAQAVEVSERYGNMLVLRHLRGMDAAMEYYAGAWDECVRVADAFIAECEAGSPHYMEPNARGFRALVRLARGDAQGARDDAQTAATRAVEGKDPQTLVPALVRAALVQVELGDLVGGAALADEAIATAGWDVLTVGGFASHLAWIAQVLQRSPALRELFDRLPQETPRIKAARAVLDGDFIGAAVLFAELGSVPEEAYARLRAAECFVIEARRAEADEQLAKALAFYRSVGATRYIVEGEALLAASP
jgi:class 3 adenylate cyclase